MNKKDLCKVFLAWAKEPAGNLLKAGNPSQFCNARGPNGFECNRPKGHKGSHVTTGDTTVLQIWDPEEPTGVDAILAEYRRPRLLTTNCLRKLSEILGRPPQDYRTCYQTLQDYRRGSRSKESVLACFAKPKTSEELLDEILAKFSNPELRAGEAMNLLEAHFNRKSENRFGLSDLIHQYHKNPNWNNRVAIVNHFKPDPLRGLIWVEVPPSVFLECQAPKDACHPCKEKHHPSLGRWLKPGTEAPKGYLFAEPHQPNARYLRLPTDLKSPQLVPIT